MGLSIIREHSPRAETGFFLHIPLPAYEIFRLVTPLREGMNLIAKGYIAARNDGQGVLVLSETAGAARELSEAIQVNPSDLDEITDSRSRCMGPRCGDRR
jgi:trehalose-6-phosphate synthase